MCNFVTLYVLTRPYAYCFFILIQIRLETRPLEDISLTLQAYRVERWL